MASTSPAFTLIATDKDRTDPNNDAAGSTHPDPVGRLSFLKLQNQTPLGLSTPVSAAPFFPAALLTVSTWDGTTGRDAMDLNFAYADGSVRRFDNVLEDDPRMAKAPYTNANDYSNGHYMQLPKQ